MTACMIHAPPRDLISKGDAWESCVISNNRRHVRQERRPHRTRASGSTCGQGTSPDTYLREERIHEPVPTLDVDGDVVGSDIVVIALGLKHTSLHDSGRVDVSGV